MLTDKLKFTTNWTTSLVLGTSLCQSGVFHVIFDVILMSIFTNGHDGGLLRAVDTELAVGDKDPISDTDTGFSITRCSDITGLHEPFSVVSNAADSLIMSQELD